MIYEENLMRSVLLCLTLTAILLGLGGCTVASADRPTPMVQEIIDQHKLRVVDYDYVLAALSKDGKKSIGPVLIDARPEKKYIIGHIPTAILIPQADMEANLHKLGDIEKSREIIVYCCGYNCTKSSGLAVRLVAMGYANLKVYAGGMPEWRQKSYAEVETEALFSSYKKNSALLIDARPYKKYIGETIPGALSIPDTKMQSLSGRFPRAKEIPIITFCGGYHCRKSHNIAKALIAEGYTHVSVYAAGMPAWKKAGFATTSRKIEAPVEQATVKIAPSGVVAGEDEGTVDGKWFTKQIGNLPTEVVLVDVRPKTDYEKGHIQEAVHIFAENMSAEEFHKNLPKEKTIVFHCASGARALESWGKLSDAKFDVSRIYYFDANIHCIGTQCTIEPNEPLGF